ncbi:MAG: Ig-like domain-containing protein, partial [Firmicutes bacterium]|nr:Ig-like domain-containing protein [Bacillota bacterium]
LVLIIAGCQEKVTITLTNNTEEITMIEGESFTLQPTTNDAQGLSYSVLAEGIVSIDQNGIITALDEGSAVVVITSKSDTTKIFEIIVNVRKLITLTSENMSLNLTEDDTHQLVISSNDDYTYQSSNTDFLVVDQNGLLTAKQEGTANIIVTSTYDPETSITITVVIAKRIELVINQDHYVLVVEETSSIDATSNDELLYQSYNPDIATVDEFGLITAIGYGLATIVVKSAYNSEVQEEITVQVYKYTTAITIVGAELLVSGMNSQLSITASPVGGFEGVTWESSDPSILTVDELGIVTSIATGTATITAISTLDQTAADTFSIQVINVSVVDSSKTTGDTFDYNGLDLEYGERLFSTIQSAIDQAAEGTIIYIAAGTYVGNLSIATTGISLIGLDDAIINGVITITADDVTIQDLSFIGSSQIKNTIDIDNLKIIHNNVVITSSVERDKFIDLQGVSNVEIINNVLNTTGCYAIYIDGFVGGSFSIKDNTISNADNGITLIPSRDYDITTEIRIMWNTITSTSNPFNIDLSYGGARKDIYAIARFNDVTGYNEAVIAEEGSTFDFTLNHWGIEEPLMTNFVNVDPYYIAGYYLDASLMKTEATYNPTLPIIITVTNPIDEIMIGETHTFEYHILPLELQDAPVKFITVFPLVVTISLDGTITPLTSGDAAIQVRSAIVSSIRVETAFSVITTPGIELLSTNNMNNVVVGDSFALSYELFPYTIENETATIVSDNPEVATIDAQGNVNALSEGLVTFRASLDSDPLVFVEYTTYVYASLDMNNLLDYLTTQQVSYSEIHDWIAYGFQYNYRDRRAESVSRYYFDNILINTSKLVPVFYAIRPGEPMDPLPAEITGFNPENIYWVVIHDTASTALGSNALAHANYLYNNTISKTELWVSWHYTIDDHDVYQHLPENERGFHAGDGSTNPGDGTYEGGGNRNGIGIEMSINEDGDMMRTWQRTAKLVVDILNRNGMPITQYKYHNDFSGKDCPNTLRNAGLIPLFEEFVAAEFYVKTNHPDAIITFTSNNPDYLDNHGRIIQIPERAMTVSYVITVTENGITESRTFYTYIPGTVR